MMKSIQLLKEKENVIRKRKYWNEKRRTDIIFDLAIVDLQLIWIN